MLGYLVSEKQAIDSNILDFSIYNIFIERRY